MRTFLCFLLVVVDLVVMRCSQPKEAPVISSVDGSRSVRARDSVDYFCNASDPNSEQLTFAWSQDGGRLGWDWGKTVRWFAPESSGQGMVRVAVTNTDGLSATDSFTITVRADTEGVLFWDAAVKPGDYTAWTDTIDSGYELYGYCGSDTGDIFLTILDDSNFNKWVSGQPAQALLRTAPYQTPNPFSVQISADGPYHIVMDNTEGAAEYSYYLDIWKAGP